MAAVNENPVGDTALSSMLDEFEEGTLLSLLEDSDLFSYLQDYPLSPSGGLDADNTVSDDIDLSELFGDDVIFPSPASNSDPKALDAPLVSTNSITMEKDSTHVQSSSTSLTMTGDDLQSLINTCSPAHSGSESDVSSLDSHDSDTAEDSFAFTPHPTKRLKLDTKGSERDGLFLTSCVEHDHCYTRASSSQHNGPSGTGTHSITSEEGINSDTGYETTSSSTSPGGSPGGSRSTHSSPTAVQTSSTAPAVPPSLTTPHLNPVALIDARIKYFMRSQQVNLTEEEKETLKAEGLPIPTTLPLTKVEEKALKSVRRKIRNKVAAQESRKRKKEHMQELEEKVRHCTSENLRLQKKVEDLESENRSLMAQLQKFQAFVAGPNSRHSTKVGACLMVIVLCFAVFFGGWAPQKHAYWTSLSSDYTTSVRSRSLLSLEAADATFPQAVCDWFRYTFLPERHIHSEQQTHSPSDKRSSPVHAWPDTYLSSYTPLTVHTHNNSAVAA